MIIALTVASSIAGWLVLWLKYSKNKTLFLKVAAFAALAIAIGCGFLTIITILF